MNRTTILLLLVIVLGGGAYFLLADQDDGRGVTTVTGADRDFAVDSSLVHKIFLADRHGNRTTLERQHSHWTYNGEYKARPDAMESLLQAIDQVQMRFKPTNAAVPHLVKNLATEGIKVELYGEGNELLKVYYIGGATNDELGTYIILEGEEQPYVASLPNWEGNIRFRYNLVGDDWRDRTIFDSAVEDIATVTVEYPKQQNNSFRLTVDEIDYKISPFHPLSPSIEQPVRPDAEEAYLNRFRKVIAVGFANSSYDRDSVLQKIPFSIITLTEKGGDVTTVKLFPQYADPIIDVKTGDVRYEETVQTYYALLNEEDFLVLQNTNIDKVLWGYSFFFE